MTVPDLQTIQLNADGGNDQDQTKQFKLAVRRAREGGITRLFDGNVCIAEIIPGNMPVTSFAAELERSLLPTRHVDPSGVALAERILSTTNRPSLQHQLEELLNANSAENVSNTPDFILASFLTACLNAFNGCVARRDDWYGVHLTPGDSRFLGEPGVQAPPAE